MAPELTRKTLPWYCKRFCLPCAPGGSAFAPHRAATQRTRLAFCNDSRLDLEERNKLTSSMMGHNPRGICFTGRTFPVQGRVGIWNCAGFSRFAAMPQVSGPVFLTIVDRAPTSEDCDAYGRLLEQLTLATAPWKIVLMRQSLCLPTASQDKALLMQLFERTGVALVISPDGPRYMRSVPVGPTASRVVRYLRLGAAQRDASEAAPAPAGLAFEAATSGVFIVVEAGEEELTASAYAPDDSLLDTVTLRIGPTPGEFQSISELLAAQAGEEVPETTDDNGSETP